MTEDLFDKHSKEIAVKAVLDFDNEHYCAVDYAALYDNIMLFGRLEYKGRCFVASQYLANMSVQEVIGQMQLTREQIQSVFEGKKGLKLKGEAKLIPKRSLSDWSVELCALGLLGGITTLLLIFT